MQKKCSKKRREAKRRRNIKEKAVVLVSNLRKAGGELTLKESALRLSCSLSHIYNLISWIKRYPVSAGLEPGEEIALLKEPHSRCKLVLRRTPPFTYERNPPGLKISQRKKSLYELACEFWHLIFERLDVEVSELDRKKENFPIPLGFEERIEVLGEKFSSETLGGVVKALCERRAILAEVSGRERVMIVYGLKFVEGKIYVVASLHRSVPESLRKFDEKEKRWKLKNLRIRTFPISEIKVLKFFEKTYEKEEMPFYLKNA